MTQTVNLCVSGALFNFPGSAIGHWVQDHVSTFTSRSGVGISPCAPPPADSRLWIPRDPRCGQPVRSLRFTWLTRSQVHSSLGRSLPEISTFSLCQFAGSLPSEYFYPEHFAQKGSSW